jgi:hypothetical protein
MSCWQIICSDEYDDHQTLKAEKSEHNLTGEFSAMEEATAACFLQLCKGANKYNADTKKVELFGIGHKLQERLNHVPKFKRNLTVEKLPSKQKVVSVAKELPKNASNDVSSAAKENNDSGAHVTNLKGKVAFQVNG